MTTWTTIDTPVGTLFAAATQAGLRALMWNTETLHALLPPDARSVAASHPRFRDLATMLAEYFAGERESFELVLDPVGTPFQLAAWQALRHIPYGETRSYGEQAKAIGRPTAVRAVGGANAKNPISIVVPCHRVIGANGSLTGFGGGMAAKRFLLEHEAKFSKATTEP
jgi:methylated-DNA-[protein]-cysteine S-methyltransferase